MTFHPSNKNTVYRPLKSVTLLPPDYVIQQQVLIDSYIEKEVILAGILPEVSHNVDITCRSQLLNVIDKGKYDKHLTGDRLVVFCLSAYNIKLSLRRTEELLLRLPMHEVAAAVYVKDDDYHIVVIKYGANHKSDGSLETQSCQMVVLYTDNKSSAEEICCLIEQCFHIIYTEATLSYFDHKIQEADGSTISSDFSTTNSNKSDRVKLETGRANAKLGFMSQSSLQLSKGNTIPSVNRSSIPRSSSQGSDSDLSPAANELILTYIEKLYTKLSSEELAKFALLVKDWHSNMTFSTFCKEVYKLYGAERKHLLLGMRPFIPTHDSECFEEFLQSVGLGPTQSFSKDHLSSVSKRTDLRSSFRVEDNNGSQTNTSTEPTLFLQEDIDSA